MYFPQLRSSGGGSFLRKSFLFLGNFADFPVMKRGLEEEKKVEEEARPKAIRRETQGDIFLLLETLKTERERERERHREIGR